MTIDSSVIIAFLRENEEKHKQCKKLFENIINGQHVALEPYIVLIEVISAIRRRTNSKTLAEKVKEDLQNLDNIFFFELVKSRAEQSSEISANLGVRGMDAIVIQIAKENNSILITLDKEMEEKAKSVVKIKNVDEIIANI